MRLFHWISTLLFPPKCILCGGVLEKNETDLCHSCRRETPDAGKQKRHIPFLENWCTIWYYEGNVRKSLHRFKFGGRRSYASVYGRLMAMKLTQQEMDDFDVLTWVPISPLRKWKRGYDQDELLARAIGAEFGVPAMGTLKKIRNNPPQSGITGDAKRKANVLGAYQVLDLSAVRDKRILLVDDIVTTGATVSECARVLLTAGAREVCCTAVAAAHNQRKNQ